MYLNNIEKQKDYMIKNIKASEDIKRRLYDIGLIKDTKIKLLYVSPTKNIKAYLIRDSIIAIRNKDASILMMEDLINLVQEQKYIKLVLKELLENCDVNNLKCLSELSKKEKTQVIKKLNEFIDENTKSIESHQNSIENLNEMLGNN